MPTSIAVPADHAPYNAGEHMLGAAARSGARARIHCAGVETTGAALVEHAFALQAAIAGAGLAPGERVLLVLQDTPLFHAAFLGALRGGFVPVPISTLLPAKDIAFIARDCDARAVVADVALHGLRKVPRQSTGLPARASGPRRDPKAQDEQGVDRCRSH